MYERYRFIKQLPSGGFGNIAVLFDKQLNREVVVKSLIDPSPENRERFVREAKILTKLLHHEHVVDILGRNFQTPNPCIILEHCHHGTLQDWLTNRELFGPPEINVAYAVQHAALGLQAIHALGGFHRDIKPANLFIGNNQSGLLTIKLGDFGFGRLPFPHTLSNVTRHACGTEGYIAPELYASHATFTAACDIYSLGITGIELLTGSKERDSINKAWIVNSELKRMLVRMTSVNPDERPSATEVALNVQAVERQHNAHAKTVLIGLGALFGLGLLLGRGD